MDSSHDEELKYQVVKNEEEQYSIWQDGRPLPPGWMGVGKLGTRSECLDYIGQVWTDMRPLSLRRAMAAEAADNGGMPS
jgi:MbtH protein